MNIFNNNRTTVDFSSLGGQVVYTPQNEEGYIKLYTSNADLFSVINYLWTSINRIDIVVLGANGEPKENGELYDLTQRPNPKQSWDEFFKQYGEYKSVIGNSYIFTPRIFGDRFKEMWVLPAQYTQIIGGKAFNEVLGYKVEKSDGWAKTFEPEEVLHIRESNLQFGSGLELYGMSRLMPGSKTVDTNSAAQDANANKQANRGIEGIISVKGVTDAGQGEKEANRLKIQLRKLLGGKGKAGDIGVTGREIAYTALGKTSAEMAILETQKHTLHQMCNLFLVPSILLDPTVANTYNNVLEAYKALYNLAGIPEVQQFCNAFNGHAGKAFGGDYLWYDTTGIEALQANMKELVEWVTKAPYTIDEMRDILGKEPTKESVWMPNAVSPVEDGINPLPNDKL